MNKRFLETISCLGNDALVPIDRIKWVILKYGNCYELTIETDDGNWIECFGDHKKALARYNEVKEILK
jgi:hypothetical protein